MNVLSPVSRESQVPLYHQVANDLRGQIAAGRWQPGDRIPPEPQLIELYGASRVTVRQALALLTQEGLLSRSSGRGTFVRDTKGIVAGSGRLTSFTMEMRARGAEPSSRVLAFDVVRADQHTADELGLQEGTEVLRLERLRFADGEPIGVQVAVLRAAGLRPLLGVDFGGESLYEHLERQFGIVIDDAEEVFSSTILDEATAQLLGVSFPSPGFLVERTGSSHGQAVEYTRSVMRGDRYRVQVHLRRGPRSVETTRLAVSGNARGA